MMASLLTPALQEALFYITAGLCTFLAILLSYHWLRRKPAPAKEERKEDVKKKSTKQEDAEETAEEKPKVPLGCPFGFHAPSFADEMQEPPRHGSLDDLLINSSDIQPLNEEEKIKLQDDSVGSENLEDKHDDTLDRKRVKELEEEVVKSMSEQQLEEERKVRQAQLEAIFNLMQDNKERFGMASVDDVQNQYKLYV